MHAFSGSDMERRIAKTCCDCCMLGIEASREAQSCYLSISVNKHCQQVAKNCCVKLDNTPSQEGVFNIIAEEGTSENEQSRASCEGSKCSQLCVGNGVCGCFEGYKLKPDGFSCDDVNECLVGSSTCQQGEQCINTEGSFRCQRLASCGTGYELTDSNLCKDIDECLTATHNCAAEFRCENKPGTFSCLPHSRCEEGYLQDAVGNCIDINECVTLDSPCQPGQTCVNTVGSYTCERHRVTCSRGYHLNEDGSRCLDVDECKSSRPSCEGHGCVNLLGSFRCECQPGFIFNSINKVCEDINECRHYPGQLCAHKCENTPGSYQCSCDAGFRLDSDGRNCKDVNECENNPCNQECANVYGSYQCYCRLGYQLSDSDGVTCEDVDECALSSGGKVCTYQCSNTMGSFKCSCPATGYTLAPNGRSCHDIDECATGTHTCQASETCFNIQGGFRCLSFDCPPNFRRIAENTNDMSVDRLRCLKSCHFLDTDCAMETVKLISHSVISLTTFKELRQPEEIVLLRTTVSSFSSPYLKSPRVKFGILTGNTHNAFDVVQHPENHHVLGVVRQVKALTGPLTVILEVAIDHTIDGVLSYRNIVRINIFISEFWF
ncbi:fibulin-1-like [Sardina pilchardus]|uniref:fibulin-1-like n=1 Tax=Sardina pilchardus TaxID=27697 RepID=UPI002E0ED41F